MQNHSVVSIVFLVSVVTFAETKIGRTEPTLKSAAWENTDDAFAEFSELIRSRVDRNLLARPGVRVLLDRGSVHHARLATDGLAGVRGGAGRVMLGDSVTVISFYLGEPKAIHEIGVFTFNIDTRSNQDYEVRWINASGNPNALPKFRDEPDLTTGDRVVGPDRGGYHTRFFNPDGQTLSSGKIDWIQFTFWPTYKAKAGDPAKIRSDRGSTAYIELEVFGPENDVMHLSAEQRASEDRIQDLYQAPQPVLKDSWHETLIASREALQQWEDRQDRVAADISEATFDSWHVLGPIPADSPVVKELRESERIDLGARYGDKDGRKIGWQRRNDLVDFEIHDLTSDIGGGKKDVVFLCRTVTFPESPSRRNDAVQVNADRSSGTWLPSRRRFGVPGLNAYRTGARLNDVSGTCQFLLEMRPDRDGRFRFRFAYQPGVERPGAGHESARASRRYKLLSEMSRLFPDVIAQAQIRWESVDEVWGSTRRRSIDEWFAGNVDVYLASRYRAAISKRIRTLQEDLACELGNRAHVIAGRKDRLAAWLEDFKQSLNPDIAVTELRAMYYRLATLQDTIATSARIRSMQLAVKDQQAVFRDRYQHADKYLNRIAQLKTRVDLIWNRVLSDDAGAIAAAIDFDQTVQTAGREILLTNPLLDFDKLLLVKGNTGFNANWGGANTLGNELAVLSPVRPDGELTTIHQGTISDMDLHWNAEKLLFSDRKTVWEINVDGSGLRRVTPEDELLRYDACYLPNGQVLFVSNACYQAVPCTGGANVGNIHVINADGTGERRLTFDQDHNWNPTIMHDGRVLYSRWEYTDAPHYFSRLLFRMNPDGTGQMAYYGSNSYWPNATYWPRPIPGHPTMVSCVVSGHHGVSRAGELVLLDPALGDHEADGAVQKIPGYGKPVEPTMLDQLVVDVWPRFAAPYPLAEPKTNHGAGKYFLACVQQNEYSTWDLCLVDIFDNITPILCGGYMTPIPVLPRLKPPVIPSHVDPMQQDATIYVTNIYDGPGLQGFPRGSIERLRVGTHHYRYFGNGDTRASSLEGGWDVKRILGTVPVNEDGSVLFRVPANTPIFLQPLDVEGKAQQVMRSWYTAMPGELISCVGCHEKQKHGPPNRYAAGAFGQRPSKIAPWFGPERGFSFEREVQPVLDRRCVGCHNDVPYNDGKQTVITIDLRSKQILGDALPQSDPSVRNNRYSETDYSPAYIALQKYVRRPGYESDYHMPKPAEYEADTSLMVQLLKKGHYGVELTSEEWERLYTWIDFNVPYPANWRESHRPPTDEQVTLRAKYKKLYAGIEDRDEAPQPLPPIAAFQAPKPKSLSAPSPDGIDGWPIPAERARQLQQETAGGQVEKKLDLGDGVVMDFMLVPVGKFVMGGNSGFADELPPSVVTIDRPFYMGRIEVTNEQYARFDSAHDSGVINERWKDRSRRGTAINAPNLPVVRISWQEAMAFCRWLSAQTGERCTLPTEAQWEWACRAGSDATFSTGEYEPGQPAFTNIADETARRWNHDRAETGYNDGVHFTAPGGRFPANPWGLCDMHGNVAEWCLSTYQPYPYRTDDGRNSPDATTLKVVRGGSWNDPLRLATSASRWRYSAYKPVYNVGFRVVLETGLSGLVTESSE